MVLTIYTDGGSRGNPGHAASAFVVLSENNVTFYKEGKYIGKTTNNIAEYTALRMAWEWVGLNFKKLNISELCFILDSELVVKQMRGEYKIRDVNLAKIASEIRLMNNKIGIGTKYVHVMREKNKEADSLVNAALDAEITHTTSTGKL